MKGKYLYGIAGGKEELRFSSRGLFNKRPYLINYNNISAIVTDAPLKTYEQDQDGVLSHNRILDEVIKTNTVLPMSFGTIAASEKEIKSLLESAYTLIRNRLSKIRDRVQFNLEIIITDEKPMIDRILKTSKEIRELRDKLVAQGENASLGDKFLIGKMIAGEVAKAKVSILKSIDAALKRYYCQCKVLAGRDVLSNFAFLVAREKAVEFESAIYKLGETYGDIIKFKYAGPLAPYNFVELKLILVNFEKVDRARRQLGMGEKATFREIKEAYRGLAREYHPDKSPGDSTKEEEFKKIADSYRLLYEYCRHYPRNLYVFKPGEINEFSVITQRIE